MKKIFILSLFFGIFSCADKDEVAAIHGKWESTCSDETNESENVHTKITHNYMDEIYSIHIEKFVDSNCTIKVNCTATSICSAFDEKFDIPYKLGGEVIADDGMSANQLFYKDFFTKEYTDESYEIYRIIGNKLYLGVEDAGELEGGLVFIYRRSKTTLSDKYFFRVDE